VAVIASFYRAGSLVFGGGHVVLPLLRAELVPRHWIGDDAFLAGYGAVQAVPGPLFTFAAYLGVRIFPGRHAWVGGLACLAAIFLPAWLLIGGVLPFWHALRRERGIRAALQGANAAVVGVLLAALYDPVWTQSVHNWRDAVAAVLACGLLMGCRAPAWLLVLAAAAAGQWLL
jgi:chromate transporter